MAFIAANLSVAVDTIAGGSLRIHFYKTADAQATVLAAGYIPRASKIGVRVGDFILVFNTNDPGNPYTCSVVSITADAASLQIEATNDAADLSFLQLGTGAIKRTARDKMRDTVSVRDFGAIGDGSSHVLSGVTSLGGVSTAGWTLTQWQAVYPHATSLSDQLDWCAIQAAMNFGRAVYLPSGFYFTNKTLASTIGQAISGDSCEHTTIGCLAGNVPVISLAAGLVYPTVRDLGLTQLATPTIGGDGIRCLGNVEVCDLKNLHVFACYNGLALQSTTYSRAARLSIERCVGDGISLTSSATSSGGQWVFDDILSQLNSGWGARVVNTFGAGMSLETWSDFKTFGNTSGGIAIIGAADGSSINAFRMVGGFVGGDGSDEIYLDSYGYGHKIDGTYVEEAGSGVTGPLASTPPSGIGTGIFATVNNSDLTLTGVVSAGHAENGVTSSASFLTITGGKYTSNGQVSGSGIVIAGASGVTICDALIGNTPGSGNTQLYGVNLGAVNVKGTISDNHFVGNVAGALIDNSTGTDLTIVNNHGVNPGAQSAITVGASPFIHAAGHMPEVVYVSGGTVGQINIGTVNCGLLSGSFPLAPNQTIAVAYSVAPTMNKSVQ